MPAGGNAGTIWSLFSLIWSGADVLGLFSINVVSFSRNSVPRGSLFSTKVVPKSRILSVRTFYVLSSLQIARLKQKTRRVSPSGPDYQGRFLCTTSQIFSNSPERLCISIGGYFGPSYEAALEKGRLTYTYWRSGGEPPYSDAIPQPEEIKLSTKQW